MARSLRVAGLDQERAEGGEVLPPCGPDRVDARRAQLSAAVGGLDQPPALVPAAEPVLVGEPSGEQAAEIRVPAAMVSEVLAPEPGGLGTHERRVLRRDVGQLAVVVV